jgi:hypothetical protein
LNHNNPEGLILQARILGVFNWFNREIYLWILLEIIYGGYTNYYTTKHHICQSFV